MSDKPNGGPAFPEVRSVDCDGDIARIDRDEQSEYGVYIRSVGGMTLRDWFAGQALAGAASLFQRKPTTEEIVAVAEQLYLLADAMLAERDK